VLGRLASSGEVRRAAAGRDGARRLPDRFSLASVVPTAKPATPNAAADAKSNAAKDAKPKATADRLRPGQLDELVLAYLTRNAGSSPHGPTAVANALGRSSGAVSNCLTRLTNAEQVRQVGEKPRRYSLCRAPEALVDDA
jgi:hypothetical protein